MEVEIPFYCFVVTREEPSYDIKSSELMIVSTTVNLIIWLSFADCCHLNSLTYEWMELSFVREVVLREYLLRCSARRKSSTSFMQITNCRFLMPRRAIYSYISE